MSSQVKLLLAVGLTSLWICTNINISSAKSINGYNDLRPVNYYLSAKDERLVLRKLICHGWPCPEFKVEHDWTPFVQERKYDAFATAAITMSGCGNFSDYLLEGYMALFRYRRGKNSEEKKITMSVPVLTEVEPNRSANETCDNKYTVHFYVNVTEDLGAVPKPTEENVTLQTLPSDLNVYVKTYNGFVDDFQSNWIEMKEDLSKLSLCFNPDKYYIAKYDPPWKKHGRRNELWAVVIPCNSKG